MQFLFGAIAGVLVYLNWDVIKPWIVSVLQYVLTLIN